MAGLQIIPEMVTGEYIFRRYGATVADYEHAANEDARLELLDGVLIMHSPANVKHEDLFWFLGGLLRGYAGMKRLGRVFGSRTPINLEDERRFEPDLIFIKNENLHRLGDTALVGPPDLAIEILSPATRDYDLGEKREAYADAKIAEYWIIDPMDQVLLVDRPAGNRHCELANGRYESAALAGFWLDVAWLWQSPLPDANACLQTVLRGA
jgi:Uma2 family endonuclease